MLARSRRLSVDTRRPSRTALTLRKGAEPWGRVLARRWEHAPRGRPRARLLPPPAHRDCALRPGAGAPRDLSRPRPRELRRAVASLRRAGAPRLPALRDLRARLRACPLRRVWP